MLGMPLTMRRAALPAALGLALAGCGGPGAPTLPFASPPPPRAEEPPKFAEIAPQAASLKAAVLMYHDVAADRRSKGVWFDVTARELERDLDFIEEHGGTVVPLEALYDALAGGKPLPEKAVVLTFDDSYQGVFDNALPILRARRAPATVFVHTGYIGAQGQKPKMTREHLRELRDTGLFDFGSHTVTHPEDITLLDSEAQRRELADSKRELEEVVGRKVRWLSWPTGNNDEYSRLLAQEAGYEMAVTMVSGLAGASPGILRVNRYSPRSLARAFEAFDRLPPVGFAEAEWAPGPVECVRYKVGRTKLVALVGGEAKSTLVAGRRQVGELVEEHGAAGGVNGGFFSMAAVASTDNTMIGPCLAPEPGYLIPDPETERLARIEHRPLVAWNDKKVVFAPFSPSGMNDSEALERLLPGATNVFVAGAWLVYDGRPLEREEIMKAASPDAMDARKRVFFGVTADGRPIAGASENGADSARLARAAAAAGAQYAVLLDSGFSTSLVYGAEILAWGHRNAEHGSRPVPHAILFYGESATTLPLAEPVELEAPTAHGTLPRGAGPRPR